MSQKYNYHIVAIDDNVAILQTLKLILGSKFANVGIISNPQLISGILAAGDVDAVLLDMNFDSKKMDGSDGLFWLNSIMSRENPPAVVLITAFGDINLAVESMKQGASDFITKPWDNDTLIEKLLKAIEKRPVVQRVSDDAPEDDSIISLDIHEKERIAAALKACKGNVSSAADKLKISRRTLYNKIKKYGL